MAEGGKRAVGAKSKAAKWNDRVPGQRELYEQKRLALIHEAGIAFGRTGFHNTSLEAITEALGLTRQAFYYYFDSKQELLFACHQQSLDNSQRLLEEAQALGGSGLGKLHHYIRGVISSLARRKAAVMLTELYGMEPEHLKKTRQRRKALDKMLRSFVRQAIDEGSIPEVDQAVVVGCVMGAVNWLPVWFSPTGRVSGDELAALYANLFINGLRHLGDEGWREPATTPAPLTARRSPP